MTAEEYVVAELRKYKERDSRANDLFKKLQMQYNDLNDLFNKLCDTLRIDHSEFVGDYIMREECISKKYTPELFNRLERYIKRKEKE